MQLQFQDRVSQMHDARAQQHRAPARPASREPRDASSAGGADAGAIAGGRCSPSSNAATRWPRSTRSTPAAKATAPAAQEITFF